MQSDKKQRNQKKSSLTKPLAWISYFIISENSGEFALNIGNLILLEVTLNGEAGTAQYSEKKEWYRRSAYPWVRQFVEEHNAWNKEMIAGRAEQLAKAYYERIFGKEIK